MATRELSNWLLKPLQPSLPVSGELLFLFDPVFDHVDFSELEHPATRRSLSEDLGVGELPKPDSGFTLKGDLQDALNLLRQTLARDDASGQGNSRRTQSARTAALIVRSLPEDVTLLEYAWISEHLHVWIVSRSGINIRTIASSRERILKSVERLYRGQRSSREAIGKVLEDLHRQLIPAGLPGGELVIVPDDFLSRVPFSALKNPRSGRYLVEEHALSIAPSANLYLDQRARHASGMRNPKSWSFLAVRGSSKLFDRPAATLPGASAEIERIRQLFPRTEILSEEELEVRPIALQGKHEVLHFSGHWDSWRTYVGNSGPFTWQLGDHVRLVVLAACSTASSGLRAKKTDFGLAEPLLARGVPAVITSLWKVEDRATSQLVIRFYESLRAGRTGSKALREAQLDLLRGGDIVFRSPENWAGLQLIGYGGI